MLKSFLLSGFILFGFFPQLLQAQTCQDTLKYVRHTKLSQPLSSTMNGPSEYSGYAQYFDCPQQIDVQGFQAYLGINTSTGASDSVEFSIWQANPDSTVGTKLDSVKLEISETYNISNYESVMLYTVMFDTPVTMNTPYFVGMEYSGSEAMGVIVNDYNAGDGNLERLMYWKWETDKKWYPSDFSFPWDVDLVVEPIVNYTVDPELEIQISGNCQDTVCSNASMPAIIMNRMYSDTAKFGASPEATFTWSDGDDSTSCKRFADTGMISITLNVEPWGWDTPCSYNETVDTNYAPLWDFTNLVDSICTGDSILVGNSYYDTTGTYSVVMQNASGCDSIVNLELTVSETPSVTMATDSTCVNNNAFSIANLGTPTGGIYSGSSVAGTSFDATAAGIGTHLVYYDYTDSSGCASRDSANITVNTSQVVTLSLPLDTVCESVNVLPLGSTGSPMGGTYSGTGVTGTIFSPPNAGVGTHTITYNYSASNGCQGVTSANVVVVSCVGIDELESLEVLIAPNPSNGWFTLSTNGTSQLTAHITDISGRIIDRFTIAKGIVQTPFDLTSENAGLYLIHLISDDGKQSTYKLLKQ